MYLPGVDAATGRLVRRPSGGAPVPIAVDPATFLRFTPSPDGLDAPTAPRRVGFLKGEIVVPKDFDRMGEAEIAALFGLGE